MLGFAAISENAVPGEELGGSVPIANANQANFVFAGTAYSYTTNFAFTGSAPTTFSSDLTEAASALSTSDVVITIGVVDSASASATSEQTLAFTSVATQQDSVSVLDTGFIGILFGASLFDSTIVVETAQTATTSNLSLIDGASATDTEGVETTAANAEPLSASTAESGEVGVVGFEPTLSVDSILGTKAINVSFADLTSVADTTVSAKTLVVDAQDASVLTSTERLIPGWVKRNSDMAFIFF